MSVVSSATDAAIGSQVPVIVPGPKFFLNIENHLYEWSVSTITREQIAELGGWDPSVGVLMIDADNNERQLAPNEVVQLKPGMGFAKKVHWKRG